MGMTCTLYRVTEADIERFVEDPDAFAAFRDADDATGPPVRVVRPKGLLGFVLRLFPITITEVDPDAPPPAHAPDPDRSTDIDKGWHGLHFLFTGTADEGDEPACYLVRGGEDVDDEGLARALRPKQVRRFADYLSGLTKSELQRRYDPARMTQLDIYPQAIWTRPASPGDTPLTWLLGSFTELKGFVSRAADAGNGLIVLVA